MLRSILRPVAVIAALAGLAAYATIMLRGPQGLSALAEKQGEIRRLELENANLRRDNDRKKHRIDSLNHDPNAQELEIRKRLKLQRHGETSFVLPDRPNAPAPSDADTRPDQPKQPLQ